jgi:hypothetical protein
LYKNPDVKLISNIRKSLHRSIQKNKHTIEYIDCNIDKLKKWIEWQFDSNMNWENYGSYWHIDHVIPCANYKVSKNLDIFKWCNLRPLQANKNLSKNDKIIHYDIVLQELKVKIYHMQHSQIAGTP